MTRGLKRDAVFGLSCKLANINRLKKITINNCKVCIEKVSMIKTARM